MRRTILLLFILLLGGCGTSSRYCDLKKPDSMEIIRYGDNGERSLKTIRDSDPLFTEIYRAVLPSWNEYREDGYHPLALAASWEDDLDEQRAERIVFHYDKAVKWAYVAGKEPTFSVNDYLFIIDREYSPDGSSWFAVLCEDGNYRSRAVMPMIGKDYIETVRGLLD